MLATSLKQQLESCGVEANIYYDISIMTRLVKYRESGLSFHFWLWRKISNYFSDKKVIKDLQVSDTVVICECTPNGFWRRLYNVEELKKILKKPILFYEVYYLGNAPTQIECLKKCGDPLFNRYDWHLAVTDVTEIRTPTGNGYSCIGLDLSGTDLHPLPKDEFIALVDFKQEGYEQIQADQLTVLAAMNIKTIVLNGRYTTEEIREMYKKASIFFIQFPEAFGLPIAECLACGVQIFTPVSGWPMSWRLDDHPVMHGPGQLADCFTVYESENDLAKKLMTFKDQYDLFTTPRKVFDDFIKNYPALYFGNKIAIKEVLQMIKDGRIGNKNKAAVTKNS
jgi:glycosyltransferase involved in cell wall biosynthesis